MEFQTGELLRRVRVAAHRVRIVLFVQLGLFRVQQSVRIFIIYSSYTKTTFVQLYYKNKYKKKSVNPEKIFFLRGLNSGAC